MNASMRYEIVSNIMFNMKSSIMTSMNSTLSDHDAQSEIIFWVQIYNGLFMKARTHLPESDVLYTIDSLPNLICFLLHLNTECDPEYFEGLTKMSLHSYDEHKMNRLYKLIMNNDTKGIIDEYISIHA